MPSGDRTGPNGSGPMSGRQMGSCGGANTASFGGGRGRGFAKNRSGLRRMNRAFEVESINEQPVNNEVNSLKEEINSLKSGMSSILEKLDQLSNKE